METENRIRVGVSESLQGKAGNGFGPSDFSDGPSVSKTGFWLEA
jgi:hypothetical protein